MEIASNVIFDPVTRRTQETLVMNFCESCRVITPIKKSQYSSQIP